MRFVETFKALGHPNIRASHATTLMVTREPELTTRGDCVVAVSAEKGLRDIDPKVKEAIRSLDARVSLILEAYGLAFAATGRGDPSLTLSHPTDMVARKSHYICERTLMIGADKAACNIEPNLLGLLQSSACTVKITLVVKI